MDDKDGQSNPIGWLQEFCMGRRWPPPHYETELEIGLPHERQFTIACVVAKYREAGTDMIFPSLLLHPNVRNLRFYFFRSRIGTK